MRVQATCSSGVLGIDRSAGLPDEAAVLRDAIHEFFRQRALGQRRRLRELLRVGRTSLAIGLVVLASAVAIGNFLASLMKGDEVGQILGEMLVVGGWVSMWRPLEIFLYDWWPIREEARLSIFKYIEVFYNRVRRHSSIGYVSPEAFEAALN